LTVAVGDDITPLFRVGINARIYEGEGDMVAKARKWLVAAVLGAGSLLPAGSRAFAQGPVPPPVLGQPVPVPNAAPPLPPPPPPPPPPSPYFPADPGRDGWGPVGVPSLPGTPFFNTELQFVGAHINNRLTGTVTLPDGTTDTVAVPGTSLGWTVMPTFVLGVRLPDSLGEFSVGYRFLIADGSSTSVGIDTALTLHERLALNVIDLDYASTPYSPAPRWTLKWRVGARIADIYFDNRAGFELAPIGEVASQRSSNYIFAGGPHAGGDVERQLAFLPELSLFGRLDAGTVIGQLRQNFAEHVLTDLNGNAVDAFSTQKGTQSPVTLSLQAGLVYKPQYLENFRLIGGYSFERWWNLGKLGDSRADLTIQGVFFRGELDF
jgi:hypothetical protein